MNAGALFGGPIWFFYRKMWAWAWGLIAAEVLLGFTPVVNHVSLPVGILIGLNANQLYVSHAIGRIQALRAAAGGAPLTAEGLSAAGGVSKRAGWVSGSVFVLLAAGVLALLVIAGGDGRP